MEEVAEVVEDRGSEAVVRIRRHSACGKCNRQCGLAGADSEQELLLTVENRFDARPGDRVRIEMEGRNIVLAAVLLFFLPLVGMVAGYFFGLTISPHFAYDNNEVIGALSSFLFLGLVFLGLRQGGRFRSFRQRFRATMTGVVGRES